MEGMGFSALVAKAMFIYIALDHGGWPRKVERTL